MGHTCLDVAGMYCDAPSGCRHVRDLRFSRRAEAGGVDTVSTGLEHDREWIWHEVERAGGLVGVSDVLRFGIEGNS